MEVVTSLPEADAHARFEESLDTLQCGDSGSAGKRG